MSEELDRAARRWIAAEQSDDGREAEDAFKTVFRAVPPATVPAGFAQAVSRRVERARQRSDSLAAVRRAGIGVAAVIIGAVMGVVWLVPLLARGVVRALEITLNAVVWLVLVLGSGLDTWDVMAQTTGTLMNALATTPVTTVLVGIEVVAAVALYAIHRMLSQEKESVR